jgi:hypothetical protein
MPAVVMTYDSLVLDIRSYLERTDAATLDKFLGNLTVATSTMVQGQATIDKPARWRKTVSINVTVAGERRPVLLRKYEYLREYWPDPTQEDVPEYYCDYDYTHWLVAPTPAAAYNYEVLYYERSQPLDESNQTNWFTQYAPQALLYGSLLQAMPFLKNDERIPMWKAQYDQVMQVLKVEDVARIGDRQTIARDA